MLSGVGPVDGVKESKIHKRRPADGWLWSRVQERIDLGPCSAIRRGGDGGRCALLLPGQFYPTRAPALWFAREVATARGWSALEVLGKARRACGSAGVGARLLPAGVREGWRQALELPGVDHALQVSGDPLASLEAMREVAEPVGRVAARA